MKEILSSPDDLRQNTELKDDFKLLETMLADSKSQQAIYHPGPYWIKKANNAANEIRRCGISDFRGSTNLIGLSYADNLSVDIRDSFNYGLKRIARWLTKTYPLGMIFDAQVRWTESYAYESINNVQEILNLKDRTKYLLERYKVPYSLLGNCLMKARIEGIDYSTHYLSLLDQHDYIASHIDFNKVNSIFEIGGGFGTNIHLLLENYKNIRKVLYLDIPPNLYVGTQYLKAIYGSTAVIDYKNLKHKESMKFSADDSLEIFCIPPWQIESFESPVDVLMNSHSFVEMPKEVVQNYVNKFNNFPESTNAAIALITYSGFDLSTTFHPNELPKFFKDRKFEYFEAEHLLGSSRQNLYFVSSGGFSL